MKKYIITLILFSLLGLTVQVKAQSERFNGVVKISVDGKVGAGLSVANEKDKVYIVSSYDLLNQPNSNINVQIQGEVGSYPATMIQHSPNLNIAILTIEYTGEKEAVQYSMATDLQLQIAQSIRAVGHSQELNWEENSLNRIKQLNIAAEPEKILIGANNLSNGYVGSPVFTDDYEWIGSISNIDGNEAYLVKANTLLKLLDSWKIPYNLILPVLSNFKEQIFLSTTRISQKGEIPVELLSQNVFTMVQSINVVLTKKGKEVKKVDPMTLTGGQKLSLFKLNRRLPARKNYALKFEIGGQAFYSDPLTIGNPNTKKIIAGGVLVGAGVLTYFLTRPLPEPPNPE